MSIQPPQFNVPFSVDGKMTQETYAMLESFAKALTEAQATITSLQGQIDALDARVTALEP